MAYFPMFMNIEKKRCLVAGGGMVAYHKVLVLLDFGAEVTVVAPQVEQEIKSIKNITICQREFKKEDLDGCVLAVAATSDREFNHRFAELAKAKGIAVNAVDQKEDCTFIFPSYIKERNLVGAFSSGGNSPLLTQYLKHVLSGVLTGELGAVGEYMGSIRETVKSQVADENMRKQVYQNVLKKLLAQNKRELGKEELYDLIAEIKNENIK